jgi:hypothetical protein
MIEISHSLLSPLHPSRTMVFPRRILSSPSQYSTTPSIHLYIPFEQWSPLAESLFSKPLCHHYRPSYKTQESFHFRSQQQVATTSRNNRSQQQVATTGRSNRSQQQVATTGPNNRSQQQVPTTGPNKRSQQQVPTTSPNNRSQQQQHNKIRKSLDLSQQISRKPFNKSSLPTKGPRL